MLRFVCGDWMVPHLINEHVNLARIDVIKQENAWYRYKSLGIRLKKQNTLHDVPNCCWHIEANGEKAFYATDMGTLEGISAKEYDLYLIEANRTEEDLEEAIKRKTENNQYSYELRVKGTHFTTEQAKAFLYENMGNKSRYVFLHQHSQ